MIILTRACAASPDSLMVSATLEAAEIYTPDARVYQYEHALPPGDQWFADDFPLSVQDIAVVNDVETSPERPVFYTFLSAEGDIRYLSKPDRIQEMIPGAGTTKPGAKFYGKTLGIRQIGEQVYVWGGGGQIYTRHGRDDWRLLTDAVLFNVEAERDAIRSAPDTTDPGYLDWLMQSIEDPATRDILFNDLQGLSEDAIYLCGETGPGNKPILCYWNGQTLEELKVPVPEAALTGIHIENPDSVWVCGREGVILKGSRARGFNPVNAPTRLNLFHGFTPYRGKLVMPASVRPGGLWQLDPATGEFGRFEPRLPALHKLDNNPDFPPEGPFFAQAVEDVLWVVASKDIFRFDGSEWERISHPDLP